MALAKVKNRETILKGIIGLLIATNILSFGQYIVKCNELSDENIEYLWSLYTKPQQNKTFNIIKTLPQEVLEIGKHYISKKFHKELGI